MNFLAAILFLATGDQVVAFMLLTKVMFDLDWRACYQDQLIKLVGITKKIKHWLLKNHKTIAVHLDSAGVLLEAQLSSPLMALFANLVSFEMVLRVLDRFLFFGERGILDIVKCSFAS